MFSHTVPADISLLRSDIGAFCQSAGFSIIAQDTVLLSYYQGSSVEPNTGRVLLNSSFLPNQPQPANNTVTNVYRLVLKDPNGDCYLHLLFYSFNLNTTRDGVSEITSYMDSYLSTGWGGAENLPDNHPNLIKMSVWQSLPSTFVGLDLFAGTNSDGSLWAHFAVEEKPLVYSHLGIGRFEKFLDFTGSDYIQNQIMTDIMSTSYSAFDCYPYAVSTYYVAGASTVAYYRNLYYAPDLDIPNKIDPANLWRSMFKNLDNYYDRPGCERGVTSYQIRTRGQSYNGNLGGGELSIILFPLPNTWTGTSPLFPIYISAVDGIDRNYLGPVGYFTGVRAVNIQNYNPKDEITLGPDIWKVYPVRTKSSVLSPYAYTSNQGYAILKNG
jgi:hypothetical protein